MAAAEASRADSGGMLLSGKSSKSPDYAASPDRKRSRVSWSTHDSDSAHKSSGGPASQGTEAGSASLQPKASIRSPRHRKPVAKIAEFTPNSQKSASHALGDNPHSQPNSQSTDVRPGSPPYSQQPEHGAQHNSSSNRVVAAAAGNGFQTFAVGRRFHPAAAVEPGQRAALRHQPSNAKDPNALQVRSWPQATCTLFMPVHLHGTPLPRLTSASTGSSMRPLGNIMWHVCIAGGCL